MYASTGRHTWGVQAFQPTTCLHRVCARRSGGTEGSGGTQDTTGAIEGTSGSSALTPIPPSTPEGMLGTRCALCVGRNSLLGTPPPWYLTI